MKVRIRERTLGTTSEALRGLRIRYVTATASEVVSDGKLADFDQERRRRLLSQ